MLRGLRCSQVDSLLQNAGLKVSGCDCSDWLHFQHPGLQLYPIADQLKEAGDVADCAAAFVPQHLLDASISSSDSE